MGKVRGPGLGGLIERGNGSCLDVRFKVRHVRRSMGAGRLALSNLAPEEVPHMRFILRWCCHCDASCTVVPRRLSVGPVDAYFSEIGSTRKRGLIKTGASVRLRDDLFS